MKVLAILALAAFYHALGLAGYTADSSIIVIDPSRSHLRVGDDSYYYNSPFRYMIVSVK